MILEAEGNFINYVEVDIRRHLPVPKTWNLIQNQYWAVLVLIHLSWNWLAKGRTVIHIWTTKESLKLVFLVYMLVVLYL